MDTFGCRMLLQHLALFIVMYILYSHVLKSNINSTQSSIKMAGFCTLAPFITSVLRR